MGITAISGPHLVYGQTKTSTAVAGQPTEYNEERAPSVFDLGVALHDCRGAYCYQPGSAVGTKTRAWYGGRAVVDQIPATINSSAIVATQVSTVSALTLVSAASGNVTPNITISTPPDQSSAATGLLVIDSTQALATLNCGLGGGSIALWDPTNAISRCVTITVTFLTTTSSFDSGVVYTVAGRDLYGYKMTESFTGTNSGSSTGKTYTGQKAFKYISGVSVTPSSGTYTGSTGICVGVADKFGFPLRVDQVPYGFSMTGLSTIMSVVSSTLYTFASTAATQTSTCPDVRGTFTSSVASSTATGVRVYMEVTPSAQNVQAVSVSNTDVSGLFGGTQFSSV